MQAHLDEPRRPLATVPLWSNEWLSVNSLGSAIRELSVRMQGGRVLDIACGNEPYKELFRSAECYVGLDIAKANSSAIVVGDNQKLPFASETFDHALCTQALEHVELPDKLLAEACRVLRPGGQLLLSAPMYWPHHEEPYDYFRFTRYGLEFLLGEAGFEIQSCIQQGGAWRLVGQSMAHAFHNAISFRTFGLRAITISFINSFFALLDRLNYQAGDTSNFAVLARKVKV